MSSAILHLIDESFVVLDARHVKDLHRHYRWCAELPGDIHWLEVGCSHVVPSILSLFRHIAGRVAQRSMILFAHSKAPLIQTVLSFCAPLRSCRDVASA